MLETGTHRLRQLLACALALSAVAPLHAQTITPTTIRFAGDPPASAPPETGNASLLALPDWPDQPTAVRAPSREAAAPTATCEPKPTAPSADRKVERPTYAVTQASVEMPAPTAIATSSPQVPTSIDGLPPARDPRRLGSPKQPASFTDGAHDQTSVPRRFIPDFGLPLDAMYTTGAALAIVIGLFLLCAGRCDAAHANRSTCYRATSLRCWAEFRSRRVSSPNCSTSATSWFSYPSRRLAPKR